MALDSYTPFSLKVHIVEHLRLQVFSGHCVGKFQQTVGERALAVVNVSDYAEIADIFHLLKIVNRLSAQN
jgi:hypothetical protein